MKSLLLPLLTVLVVHNSGNAEISYELYIKCLEVWDYAGCVKTNKKLSNHGPS